MPFGIVPQNVMRDKTLTVQERWLYALLCTHADKNGYCRRSLKAIAGEAGVLRRTVQKWRLGLETRGLVCKLNGVGKMGVYQVIRHKNRRGAAQMKNVTTVTERKIKFSVYGKKGAVVRAEKRKGKVKPVSTETPPPVSQITRVQGCPKTTPNMTLKQDFLNRRKKTVTPTCHLTAAALL